MISKKVKNHYLIINIFLKGKHYVKVEKLLISLKKKIMLIPFFKIYLRLSKVSGILKKDDKCDLLTGNFDPF